VSTLILVAAFTLAVVRVTADLDSDFTAAALPANLFLDRAAGWRGDAFHETATNSLRFTTIGNTDMWCTRAQVRWALPPTTAFP